MRTTLHPEDTDAARMVELDIEALTLRCGRLGLQCTMLALQAARNICDREHSEAFRRSPANAERPYIKSEPGEAG